MSKEPILVFDSADKLLTIFTEYINAPFDETSNHEATFEVVMPGNADGAEHFIGGNQVAFRDLERKFRLFTIREVDSEDGNNFEKTVFCTLAFTELQDHIIPDVRAYDTTASDALDRILAGTRYERGNVVDLGINSANFYYVKGVKGINILTNTWGGEVVDRIEVDDTGIAGRYIDIIYRRGADNGKRFEIDKDIQSIIRTALYYPKTALYGRGSSIESGDGYSRKTTFADVEWLTSNGNPVNKPLGQEWVGDPDALEDHGIPQGDGSKKHRFGTFENGEEEDKEALLQNTWIALQDTKEPKVRYKMSVNTFYGIAGYEHEQVLFGDTGAIIDGNIQPAILLESRVIRLKYDIGNPSNGEVTIGNFLELNKNDENINWTIEKLNDKIGLWDQKPTITDENFPDTVPNIPTDFATLGAFSKVILTWDYLSQSFISHYELYASEVPGFVPDATNLIWKGKAGSYIHESSVDKQWYYRLRAVNYHATVSNFTNELLVQTLQVNADTEIAENTITKHLLAQEAIIESIHLGEATVKDIHITGKIASSKVVVGSASGFDEGYDPSKKATSEELNNVVSEYQTSIDLEADQILLTVDEKISNSESGTIQQFQSELSQTKDNFNIQFTDINDTVSGHGDEISEINSYFDFSPEGLNIGKSDSPLNINISNEQMDFIDNGDVVAYVNGQKMYINSLEVLSSMVVGVHKIEKYDNNITLVRWVGE